MQKLLGSGNGSGNGSPGNSAKIDSISKQQTSKNDLDFIEDLNHINAFPLHEKSQINILIHQSNYPYVACY